MLFLQAMMAFPFVSGFIIVAGTMGIYILLRLGAWLDKPDFATEEEKDAYNKGVPAEQRIHLRKALLISLGICILFVVLMIIAMSADDHPIN